MLQIPGIYTWLITGGNGFIGRHLTAELLRQKQNVVTVDLTSAASSQTNWRAVQGDISQPDFANQVCHGVDFILHHAALSSVAESVCNPLPTLEQNYKSTSALLAAARSQYVKRFIFASSSSVYGPGDGMPHTEKAALHPLSPYALSKMQGEQLCTLFNQLYGLPTVSLRYFNVYGPGQNADGPYAAVLPRFASMIRRGAALTLRAGGLQTRDFVHVADVVQANLLAAFKAAAGQTYNVASGQNYSLLEAVKLMEKIEGRTLPKEILPAEQGSILHSSADITKLRTLGFCTQVTLEQGLHQLLNGSNL